MSITPQPIDADLTKSLSAKSDRELIDILDNSADWRPEVVDFARSELGRRSTSNAQIAEKLVERTKQRATELQKQAMPLTFWPRAAIVLTVVALFCLVFPILLMFSGAYMEGLGLFFVLYLLAAIAATIACVAASLRCQWRKRSHPWKLLIALYALPVGLGFIIFSGIFRR